MTEFLPPDEMTLDGAGDALRSGVAAGDQEMREADRTFYDTFDGLLHAERLELVHESGRLALIETQSGHERAGLVTPPPTAPMLAAALPAGSLRDEVVAVCGVRALLPLVHVHSRVRTLRVLDDEEKTVVRMSLEEPRVVSDSSSEKPLRPRIRITPVRGYGTEFDEVRGRLERELGFKVADQPLVDEALRAAGELPGGTPSKIKVSLGYSQRTDEAAVHVLRRLLDVIEANIDGTVADIDTEFLHDFRVSVRRSRAVQRELKRAFPPAALERFREEFRWLQQATGEARDLDVYVLEFEEYRAMVPQGMAAELDPLLTVLREQRVAAHREGRPSAAVVSSIPRARDGACSSTGCVRSRQMTGPMRRGRSGTWPASGSRGSTGGWSRWGRPSTTPARPRRTTSSARRARSCATCWSCSARRCTPTMSSGRW